MNFAFLLLEEHPYGREMLRQILAGGFVPRCIVEERSDVAESERTKFLERIAGHDLAPTVREQVGETVPILGVAQHDSDTLLPLLESLDLDLVVLGGTRVIRGEVLDLPRDGVINSHPGLLPECRGSASPAWSVLHDIPVGATTHFCDASIDTGDILLRRELPVAPGATYEDLCHGTLLLAGTLMREALEAHAAGRWAELRRPQGDSQHPTFKNAPDEVLEAVRAKLAAGAYAPRPGDSFTTP